MERAFQKAMSSQRRAFPVKKQLCKIADHALKPSAFRAEMCLRPQEKSAPLDLHCTAKPKFQEALLSGLSCSAVSKMRLARTLF